MRTCVNPNHNPPSSSSILQQGALLQTKTLRQDSAVSSRHVPQASTLKEDARWIKTVIQQEHLKPLEVSRDFVLDFEKRERENADHLSSQVGILSNPYLYRRVHTHILIIIRIISSYPLPIHIYFPFTNHDIPCIHMRTAHSHPLPHTHTYTKLGGPTHHNPEVPAAEAGGQTRPADPLRPVPGLAKAISAQETRCSGWQDLG
ncbi:hypothetical protein EON64_21260 [archaeon]|nr:MAG: hypothetical protein EON64_21260 [archaeon]